jgi:hypothetical protein
MKGPCAAGYHVPTQKEWCEAIRSVSPDITVCDVNTYAEVNSNKLMNTLRLPPAGLRSLVNGEFANQ